MATLPNEPRTTTITLASAIAGPFDLSFRLFDDDAIKVYLNGTQATNFTLSSSYTDGYDDNASITFDTPLEIGDVVVIDSDLVPERSVDYINGAGLVAQMNDELARLWSVVSDLRRDTHRSVRLFTEISPANIDAGKAIVATESGIEAGPDASDIAEAQANALAAQAAQVAAEAAQTGAEAAENSILENKGSWLTATDYELSDIVQYDGSSYVCKVAHTSGIWATDLGNTYWEIFAAKGTPGAGTGDMLGANNLNDVSSVATSRANLGLSDVATLNFSGMVCWFALSTAPTGFLSCDGSAVSRVTYASLFARIGTVHGAGDGATTFNLPDLRGEFIRGWDDGRGIDAGRVFGSSQSDEFKSHTHDMTFGDSGSVTGLIDVDDNSAADDPSPFTHTTESTGGVETRPRNVALLACIKT